MTNNKSILIILAFLALLVCFCTALIQYQIKELTTICEGIVFVTIEDDES